MWRLLMIMPFLLLLESGPQTKDHEPHEDITHDELIRLLVCDTTSGFFVFTWQEEAQTGALILFRIDYCTLEDHSRITNFTLFITENSQTFHGTRHRQQNERLQ